MLIILTVLLLTGGCARKTETEPVVAYYYPACHEPLAYLHQRSQSSTGRAIAGGAVQGGVISGIASAIIGAIAGGSFRPAAVLASVGVGAAIGGVASGVSQSSVDEREDNKHLAAYLEQIDGNIEGMNIIQAAATASRQCYGKEFKMLLTSLDSMPENVARKRLGEILAGREETAKLLDIPSDNEVYEEDFSLAAKKAYAASDRK